MSDCHSSLTFFFIPLFGTNCDYAQVIQKN